MVLMGLLSSALAFTVSSGPAPLKQVREQLQRYSLLIYEQAVIRDQLLGLQITPEGSVRTLVWQADSASWQPDNHTSLIDWSLPANTHWQFQTGPLFTQRKTTNTIAPQVLFNPQGLVSPFRLTLRLSEQPAETLDDRFFYPQARNADP